MGEDSSFPSIVKASGRQEDVLGQIDGLQAQLDELRSSLDLPRADLPSPRTWGASRLVKAAIGARRKREAIFGQDLFADPAWDVLLELYAAKLAQRRVPTSELCKAAAVPGTTALRWIEKLDRLALVRRLADPLDARRVFVELTPRATAAMESYFNDMEFCVVAT